MISYFRMNYDAFEKSNVHIIIIQKAFDNNNIADTEIMIKNNDVITSHSRDLQACIFLFIFENNRNMLVGKIVYFPLMMENGRMIKK